MEKRINRLFCYIIILLGIVLGLPMMKVSAVVELPESDDCSVITAFDEFDVNKHALHLMIEYKPSLEEICDMMPESLSVYLNGESELENIPVDWYCVGEDYETSEGFYFQFSPVWDENAYVLSEEIDLLTEAPYMAVYFKTESEAISTYAVTNQYYESFIFEYLTDTLGFHTAAACGAMANIYAESAFIPTNLQNTFEKTLGFSDASYTMAVDDGSYTNFVRDSAGYGLCQWTFWTRKQALLEYAQSLGKSIGDPGMQLSFLNKELMACATGKYMKAAANTEQGAYDVGYYFCQNFERPAQVADEKSIVRGNLAKNYYWEEYCDSIDYTLYISGQSQPDSVLTEGSEFSVTGVITSEAKIQSLTVGVYGSDGVMVTGKTVAPFTRSYDLSSLNSEVVFASLDPGCYYYRVQVKNAGLSKTMIEKFFIVSAKSETIAEGTYMMVPMVNRSMAVAVKNHSDSTTAKFCQENNTNSEYQYFEVIYAGSGYYYIKNVGSGLYLEAADGTVQNNGSVWQNEKNGTAAQKWQILPVGSSYCIVPQAGRAYCLSIESGSTASGANLLLTKNCLDKSQQFNLISGDIGEVFRDINTGDWYIEYLKYVYENGLMSGNDGKFEPNGTVTKAMVAQVLYNLEGKPEVTDKRVFTALKDVYAVEWYADAVAWAYDCGVVTGDLNTKKFSPNANVTREQLALMLYRYAIHKGYDTEKTSTLKGLLNAENVSNWAEAGVKWAVGAELISGIDLKNGTYDLAPQQNATRAQLAAILMRFCEANDI